MATKDSRPMAFIATESMRLVGERSYTTIEFSLGQTHNLRS
jgi:hypothetical protein